MSEKGTLNSQNLGLTDFQSDESSEFYASV